jgi:hypothetical protein
MKLSFKAFLVEMQHSTEEKIMMSRNMMFINQALRDNEGIIEYTNAVGNPGQLIFNAKHKKWVDNQTMDEFTSEEVAELLHRKNGKNYWDY